MTAQGGFPTDGRVTLPGTFCAEMAVRLLRPGNLRAVNDVWANRAVTVIAIFWEEMLL
jgi:hypothetical protein